VEIIAHRGASHDAPENTLAAVRLAWAQGADAVEVDVHLTADEQLVVIHDPDTSRTAGTARLVQATSFAELRQLDVGQWKDAAFAGERIPLLDAVCAAVPLSRRVYLELKVGGAALGELVRTLARSRLTPARVAVITFDLDVARTAKRLLPRTEVAWLVEAGARLESDPMVEIVHRAQSAGLDGLGVDAALLDESVFKRTRAAGLKVHAWTVDDPELARQLVAWEVDGITTNRPGWLRRELNL